MHKTNFIPSLVFEILKFLWAYLDMPDPTHVKLHHQYVALIDMYLHAKNQLYTPDSFSDIIV